ncbi:aldose 1-epimerase family protein [Clostridium sp.]|uniref:aldose 1-epimerase family protein n=1 Tax=Clostridium sp. TaxID=1506 RepID=UPI003F3D93B2
MLYELENNNIKIIASTFGGELHSIKNKNDDTEYLWNGNEEYWKYHSPVLFPIVGRVKDNTYRVDGKNYELPQHGLARTREFEMIEKSDSHIVFELTWSEDTLKVYPYKFSLKLTYTLLENGVTVGYTVANADDNTIYFSIGAHPAFMCPIESTDSMNDCYFEFNKTENSSLMVLDPKTGYFTRDRKEYLNNTNILPISLEVFKNDALVFDDLKSNIITIKSKNNNKSLSMDFTGFPYMALWTKATGAPFVCLEPWYGHSDYEDFTGELKDKAGIEKLNIGESFNASYGLFINL